MTRLETSTGAKAARQAQSAAERFGVIERPELKYTPAVARETAHLYDRVRDHIPEIEWPVYAPYVHAINRIKKERGAASWRTTTRRRRSFTALPTSSAIRCSWRAEATLVDEQIIIQCGVHFMAETSKLLNPDKTVLIPDMKAGCSLSESITGADVRLLANAIRAFRW
jgi:quinolinate synthase